MSIKNYIYVLLVFLSLPFIHAESQFVVTPSVVTADVTVGSDYIFPISVKNTANYSFFDVQFSGLSYTNIPMITELQTNQNLTVSAVVHTTGQFNNAYTGYVNGKYRSKVEMPVQSIFVNVTDAGFYPNPVNMSLGDTLVIKNTGSVSHNPVATGKFDIMIPVNGTYSYSGFTQLETVDYFDRVNTIHGIVNVLNRTREELTINDNFRAPFTLILNSGYNQGNITFRLIKGNLTVEVGKTKEGAMSIENLGTNTVYNAQLSGSDWVVFSENNFNLTAGDENTILFTVRPKINRTDQTEKTYTLPVTLSGQNIPTITKLLSVFVPFFVVSNFTGSSDDLFYFQQKAIFCREFPTSKDCMTEPIYIDRNTTVTIPGQSSINLTDEQVLSIFNTNQRLADELSLLQNIIKIDVEEKIGLLTTEMSNLRFELNRTSTVQETSVNQLDNIKVTVFVIIFFFFMTISVGTVLYVTKKKKDRDNVLNIFEDNDRRNDS